MAKILPILGTLSGSIAGNTFSHNRGGRYVRSRSIPVNPTTPKQSAIRQILALASGEWNNLTPEQRDAWVSWATYNPYVDSLGQSVQLSGQQAYVSCASRLLQGGATLPTDPPVTTGPSDLNTLTAVLTAPDQMVLTYTTTPLPAGAKLILWGTLPAIGGRNPNRAQARLIGISAAAAASPQTITTPYTAIAGQFSNIWVAVMDDQGLVSPGIGLREEWQ